MFAAWFLIVLGLAIAFLAVFIPPPFFPFDNPPDYVFRLASILIVGIGAILAALGMGLMAIIDEIRGRDSVTTEKSRHLEDKTSQQDS